MRRRSEDGIKIEDKEINVEYVDWSNVAVDRAA
jgi:hypothetical protein